MKSSEQSKKLTKTDWQKIALDLLSVLEMTAQNSGWDLDSREMNVRNYGDKKRDYLGITLELNISTLRQAVVSRDSQSSAK